MGECINSNFDGICYYFEEGTKYEANANGVSVEYGFNVEEGACVVEDDECPEDSCSCYETDFRNDEDEEQIAANEHLESLEK